MNTKALINNAFQLQALLNTSWVERAEQLKGLKQIKNLVALPGGKRALNHLIGLTAPFSGKLGVKVDEITDGYIVCTLPDRRAVRNHVGSIHAGALATFADTVAALTVLHTLPQGSKPVNVNLNIHYSRIAKGPIRGEAQWEMAATDTDKFEVPVTLKDQSGTVVATAMTYWKLLK